MHPHRLRVAVLLLAASLLALPLSAAPLDARQRAGDFDALWSALDSGYAYFGSRRGAWRAGRAALRARAVGARDRAAFVAALEQTLASLRDDHVALSERTGASPRRVPAEVDIWPAWRGPRAVVEAVRTFGDADVAGLRPGDEIRAVEGVAIERVVRQRLDKAPPDEAARDWALRQALAGPRHGKLRLEVADRGTVRTLEIERQANGGANGTPVLGRRIGDERDLGYIRLRGSLADPRIRERFDAALDSVRETRALVIDLRDADGDGGSAGVEAILGRFVAAPTPWRRREDTRGGQTDMVGPRGIPYRAPLVVLVDRWTAGDGEALAAGLAAVANARLVGTRMAGLQGELREVALPHSGLKARFPAERVLHVDGTPRERLRPAVEVDLAAPSGGPGDPILYQALKILERK